MNKNIDYAPVILKKSYELNENFRLNLNNWFKGRGIPSWRDRLDILLSRLNISTPEELLDKAFGLSLSDHYWIKPVDSNIQYNDINFFDHDFDVTEFLEASFSNIVKDKVVSKCECFISKDTELVPAFQIMYGIEKHQNKEDYNEYIKILEENAPIFDNGQSLNMTIYDNDEIGINGEGRLFYNIVSFDDIIKIVHNMKRIDITKLDGVVEDFDCLLHKYQNIIGIS